MHSRFRFLTGCGLSKLFWGSFNIAAASTVSCIVVHVFEDLYEETVLAGFCKIDSVISGFWYTDEDESEIADLARELGVNLKFTSYTRYCTKD